MIIRRQRAKLIEDINVIPLIDVMLVLLVCFILIAPGMVAVLDIQLPKSRSGRVLNQIQDKLEITIDRKGKLFIKEKTTTLIKIKDIIQKIRKQRSGLVVLIKADKNLTYGRVAKLMAKLQGYGVDRVGLLLSR